MTWNQSSCKGVSSLIIKALGICLLSSTMIYSEEFSSQQAFQLKRITEYWKEGDTNIAKSQIKSFLAKHPNSKASDSLHAMLGDLLLKEDNYVSALEEYQKIQGDELITKIQFNKAICLFHTDKFDELIELANRFLAFPGQDKESETVKFLLAKSLHKKALIQTDLTLRNSFLSKALPHYKDLLGSKFSEYVILPAANISEILEKYNDAIHLYKLHLEKNPQDREQTLFKIAILQETTKPKEAVKTFGVIYKLKGELASDAAQKQLQLLFKEQRYKDLLIYQEEAIKHIDEKNLPKAYYWIGKSLFYLEDFQQAQGFLNKSLKNQELDAADQKIIITNLITCAFRNKDISQMKFLIKELEKISPSDPDLAEAYLIEYQMLNLSDQKAACQSLQKLVDKYPYHKDKESILFNLANLQYKLGNWSDCATTVNTLHYEFPYTKFENISWRIKLNSLIEELKEIRPEHEKIKKTELASNLEQVIYKTKALSEQEKNQYHFIYCQMLYQIDKIDEAICELQKYIDNTSNEDHLGPALLLMAHAYSKNDEDLLLFISSAEKALKFDQANEDKYLLHLKLFNSYLIQAQSAKMEHKSEAIEKAADNLYLAFCIKPSVKEDNLSWLSNFYYEKARLSCDSNSDTCHHYCARAASIIEHFLGIHNYPPSAKLRESAVKDELEILKLAQLLKWQKKHSEKVDLLEVLVFQHKNYPDIEWKYQRKALLELASSYADCGLIQDAIETYDHVISSSEYSSSYSASLATLEKCKLRYKVLSEFFIQDDSAELISILDDLKDLEVKRKLYSEPIHLEAALTYIDFKTAHLHRDKKREKELQLLIILKDNYSNSSEQSVIEYDNLESSYPEQTYIYQNYMKFIDSLILIKKAEIAYLDKKRSEVPLLLKQANSGLKELAEQNDLPIDLCKRVRSQLEAMEKPI